jgi:hypothetical protein
MKDLLYKEFKLAVHPSIYMFLCFGALLLIPSWPFFIAFGYIFMGLMNTFFVGRANQDLFFTASLPVRKRDVVFSRVLSTVICEIAMIIAAIPFAILHNLIFMQDNGVGMNLNISFFGFVLVMYAVFNGVFFPLFYKNGYKAGIPILLGIILSSVFAVAVEFAVHAVPELSANVNALGTAHLEYQMPVLAAGIVIYMLVTWLAGRRAGRNFEKVDL